MPDPVGHISGPASSLGAFPVQHPQSTNYRIPKTIELLHRKSVKAARFPQKSAFLTPIPDQARSPKLTLNSSSFSKNLNICFRFSSAVLSINSSFTIKHISAPSNSGQKLFKIGPETTNLNRERISTLVFRISWIFEPRS